MNYDYNDNINISNYNKRILIIIKDELWYKKSSGRYNSNK